MTQINCINCGQHISDNAQVCPKCGASISDSHPQVPTQHSEVVQQSPKHRNLKRDKASKKKSRMGLLIGIICGAVVAIIASIVVVVLYFPQLRFWESNGKSELLETAYNEGYICGKQFGDMDKSEFFLDAARRTYMDVTVDENVSQEFDTYFLHGMMDGVNGLSPNSERDFSVAEINKLKKEATKNISGTYSGNVGEFSIEMTLNQSNEQVNGDYRYVEYGNSLNLSGCIKGTEISLNETTPKKGNHSATWTLNVTKNGLEGSMYVNHTGKTHNVSLTRIQ